VSLGGKQVLVTGAGGFIGSHLVEALVAEGARVRALCRYNAQATRGWLDHLPRATLDAVEIVAGDVRDAGAVDAAVRGAAVVFHLAALIGVPYSYQAPGAYLATNITGTLHVLEAARRHAVERLLVASTSEVYGSARTLPIDEEHRQVAQSPYAATKIAADRLAESFWRSFDLPVTIVRPFNVYGPRQSARAVIPTAIVQLLGGARTVRLGSLAPRRDFTFVADTAGAFVAVARAERTIGLELNVASGSDLAVGDVLELLIARIAPGAAVTTDDARLRPARSEVDRLCGSSARLRALTGWQPTWTFERGLDATIAWFRDPANLARYPRPGEYHV
jgi:NAD dependent epimerase/dehydratase